MKFHDVLEEILGKKSNISILRVLASRGFELTGRQIAQLSNLNHRTCQISLKELVGQGVVAHRRVGKSDLFKLKKENLLVSKGILPLLEVERRLLEEAQALISGELTGGKVLSLILFGSVASGREGPDSDLDVCVVLKDGVDKGLIERAEDGLNPEIIKKFGNSLALYPIGFREFNKKYSEGDRLIEEIAATGEVFWGKPLKEVLGRGREKQNQGSGKRKLG
jgi:predicted nucleotidyltransferase